MSKIYLAGGLKSNWQDRAAEFLSGCELLDPRTWQETGLSGYSHAVKYTESDLSAIRACDVLVAYMDSTNPSGFGLCIEIGYAKALGKTIIFVDLLEDARSKYFDMARVMANAVVGSFEALPGVLSL